MCGNSDPLAAVSNPNPEAFIKAAPIAVKLYKGMPTVELKEDDKFKIHLELTDKLSKQIAEHGKKGNIQISLQHLEVDKIHNQSFGMVAGSTGCVSNPGGPGC